MMRRPIGAIVVPGRQDKTRYQAVMKQFITAFRLLTKAYTFS